MYIIFSIYYNHYSNKNFMPKEMIRPKNSFNKKKYISTKFKQ